MRPHHTPPVMSRLLALAVVASVGLAGCDFLPVTPPSGPPPSEPGVVPNTLAQLRADMTLAHEGVPSGVGEHEGWRLRPRVGYGNTPPDGWTAMITWGQVYVEQGATAPANVRVQVKSLRTWVLSRRTGAWKLWQRSDAVGGANYAESYADDENVAADIRDEGEGVSATVPPGYNFHFWIDETRPTIDPDDIEAVWSAVDGRLVLDDPAGPDRRAGARLMLSAGADYWASPSAVWDQWTTNGDVGIGRFRFLTADWQTFNMHTASDSVLRANPPPVDQ